MQSMHCSEIIHGMVSHKYTQFYSVYACEREQCFYVQPGTIYD